MFLKTKQVSVFDGGTPALKRRTVIARRRQRENAQTKIRKTAEKLLLNRLKEMRLKEQPNDLKKQRLQQSRSAGDKKRVFSVSLEEPLRDSADEDGAGAVVFRRKKWMRYLQHLWLEKLLMTLPLKGPRLQLRRSKEALI